MKQAVEERSHGMRLRRNRMRFLHLSENLRFADHERVESRGDAEQMPRDLAVGEVVHMWLKRASIDLVVLADEGHDIVPRCVDVVADAVELRPIARRQDDRLARGASRGKRAQGRRQAVGLKIEPLAQLHGRGPMTDSNE